MLNAYLYSGVIYNLEEIKFMLNHVPILKISVAYFSIVLKLPK